MNLKTMIAAKKEAERFIVAVKAAIAEKEADHTYATKLSGAARRASMDLTRALADMRRPGA